MKKILCSFFVLLITIFLFSGCSQNYTLTPQFDGSNGKLTVLGKDFYNAELAMTRNPVFEERIGMFRTTIKNFISDDEYCKRFHYYAMDTVHHRAYIIAEPETDFRIKYVKEKNGECYINKFSNIKFINCKESYGKDRYFITSSEANAHGFGKIEVLTVDDKCFNSMLSYFKDKESKGEVKSESYKYDSINNKHEVLKSKKYMGSFNYGGMSKSCINMGEIKLDIKDNYFLSGEIKIGSSTTNLEGRVEKDRIKGTFKNGTFDGKINSQGTINGTYLSGSCYGTFLLETSK